MIDILKQIEEFLMDVNFFSASILGFSLVVLESLFPVFPLAAFITFNRVVLGGIRGFLVSYIGIVVGSMLSFFLTRKLFRMNQPKKIKNISLLPSSFQMLTLFLSLPFSPASVINVAAGLSNLPSKKYFLALVCSKPIVVFFWEFIGMNIVESIQHKDVLLKLVGMLGVVYGICIYIKRYIRIE